MGLKIANIFKLSMPVLAVVVTSLAFIQPAFSQYHVSGVLEFSYRGYQTKIGDRVTNDDSYWSKLYRANIAGDLFDPRFIKFSGGIGYSTVYYRRSSDTSHLDYNMAASIVPGLKVSGLVFGSSSTQNIESNGSLTGYDVKTDTYGGTLYIIPGKGGGRNNNNRNRNGYMKLPDITVSRTHMESESANATAPISESRDDTLVGLYYRPNGGLSVSMEGRLEEYFNELLNSTYETKTANLQSTVRVAKGAKLDISGSYTDRQTSNITGAEASSASWNGTALLDFIEKDGLRHYYRYLASGQKTPSSDLVTHRAEMQMSSKQGESMQYRGGVRYGSSSYAEAPTPVSPAGAESALETIDLVVGAMYRTRDSNEAPLPFSLVVLYDFSPGYSFYATDSGGQEGSGEYYTNDFGVTLSSNRWKQEEASIGYQFSNKRDGSPVNNDMIRHTYRASLLSRRFARTLLRGSVNYAAEESRYEAASVFLTSPTALTHQEAANQLRRSFTFDVAVEHALSDLLFLSGGATRGLQQSTMYTLSTFVPDSSVKTEEELLYGSARFRYPITRLLVFRAELREEYRATTTVDIYSHLVSGFLDYRIRSIFVNLEYRWRQDIPDSGLKTEQQYFFAKLSRPF